MKKKTFLWVVIGMILVTWVLFCLWTSITRRAQFDRIVGTKRNLSMFRAEIRSCKEKTGEYPSDLSAVFSNYPHFTINYLCDQMTQTRVSAVFDRGGGWFYNPSVGDLKLNSKPIIIWVVPPLYRTEDPSNW